MELNRTGLRRNSQEQQQADKRRDRPKNTRPHLIGQLPSTNFQAAGPGCFLLGTREFFFRRHSETGCRGYKPPRIIKGLFYLLGKQTECGGYSSFRQGFRPI